MYPAGVTWPGGTWPAEWSPGHTGYHPQREGFTSPNPYKDPYLGGFFGSVFNVIKKPFEVAYDVGKTVVKAIPEAGAGFIAGGIPGAIAAGGAAAIADFTRRSPQEQEAIRQELAYQEVENRVPAYTPQYTDSISDAANRAYQRARDAVLAEAGERVARTPAGRAAITQTVKTDIMEGIKPLLPFLLVGGALIMLKK